MTVNMTLWYSILFGLPLLVGGFIFFQVSPPLGLATGAFLAFVLHFLLPDSK